MVHLQKVFLCVKKSFKWLIVWLRSQLHTKHRFFHNPSPVLVHLLHFDGKLAARIM